jgi:sirohydrochlorin ferrochelatase
MRALLIMAHGSPRPEANGSIHAVADLIRRRALFDRVEVAFLDCNEPTIPDGLDMLAGDGAAEVVAVPYFLHAGRHVVLDIPQLIREAGERHPAVRFRLGEFLGRSEEMTQVLLDRSGEKVAK